MNKDLKSAAFADAALGTVRMATFSVSDKAQAEDVIGPIADYLGADRDRHLVRLRFGDDVRYLRRADVYKFVDTAAKGFGEGGYASPPGHHALDETGDYQFRCPVDGCPDSPVFMLAFTEAPACPRHHVPLDLVP
jgi:hypothetical protein